MKKGILGLASFSFALLLLFFLAQTNVLKGFQSDFNLAIKSDQIRQNQSFVVIVNSCEKHLNLEKQIISLLEQNYDNYRIVFVGDRWQPELESYLAIKETKVSFSYNSDENQSSPLFQVYKAIHACKDDEIVVLLDSSDWFNSENVLSDLNAYYQNDDIWMSYGNFIIYPDQEIIQSKWVKKSFLRKANFRKDGSRFSKLRTFYAGLFKKIKLEDFMDKGLFFSDVNFNQIIFPMLEMAREHVYFTPDIFLATSERNLIANEVVREDGNLMKHKKYEALPAHPKTCQQEDFVDLLVFSYNRPLQLYALLESLEKLATGVRKIGVIYREDPEYASGYKMVKNRFSEIHFFQQSNVAPKKDFKPLVMDFSFGEFGKGASYIAYAVDDIIITDEIDFKVGVEKLRKTSAYGLFYRLGKHTDFCYSINQHQGVPNLIDVEDGYYAWQFSTGKGDWNYPNSVDLVLYNKADLKALFDKLKFTFPNDFEGEWAKYADANKIGLCYERAKMVNIPMNIVSSFNNRFINSYSAEELNLMFLKGLKIDIEPFYHIMNNGAHADIAPQFIQRDE